MIQTVLPAGAYPHGALNFDWLYRTPAFPDGVSQVRVQNLDRQEQVELAEYWFRLNFLPFEPDGPWFTLGVSVLGGPDLLAPEHESPLTVLEAEFGYLSAELITDLATRLLQEAAEWRPVPPDLSPPADDPAGAVSAALERVQADLDRAGPGHNQGPPFDPTIVAEIREQVRLGLAAVDAGADGKQAGESIASSLLTIAGTISSSFAQGVAKKAGEETEPLIKHSLAFLLDHMLQAVSALAHWIASIPPGPLL